jgi:hypothetical protein
MRTSVAAFALIRGRSPGSEYYMRARKKNKKNSFWERGCR